jgi:hypothetical protein
VLLSWSSWFRHDRVRAAVAGARAGRAAVADGAAAPPRDHLPQEEPQVRRVLRVQVRYTAWLAVISRGLGLSVEIAWIFATIESGLSQGPYPPVIWDGSHEQIHQWGAVPAETPSVARGGFPRLTPSSPPSPQGPRGECLGMERVQRPNHGADIGGLGFPAAGRAGRPAGGGQDR